MSDVEPLEQSLEQVLTRLSRQTATGALLVVDSAGSTAEIYLRSGLVYAVSMPGNRTELGSRLVLDGVLTDEALAQARETQRTELTDWHLGELLVHLRLVDRAIIEAFTVEQMRDGLGGLLGWAGVSLRFESGRTTRQDVVPEAEVVSLLADVRDRQRTWARVVTSTGGAHAVPARSARLPVGGGATLPLRLRRVLAAVNGERSIAELAGDCGLTVFEAGGAVAALLDASMVAVPLSGISDPSADPYLDCDMAARLDPADAAVAAAVTRAVADGGETPIGGTDLVLPLVAVPSSTGRRDPVTSSMSRRRRRMAEAERRRHEAAEVAHELLKRYETEAATRARQRAQDPDDAPDPASTGGADVAPAESTHQGPGPDDTSAEQDADAPTTGSSRRVPAPRTAPVTSPADPVRAERAAAEQAVNEEAERITRAEGARIEAEHALRERVEAELAAEAQRRAAVAAELAAARATEAEAAAAEQATAERERELADSERLEAEEQAARAHEHDDPEAAAEADRRRAAESMLRAQMQRIEAELAHEAERRAQRATAVASGEAETSTTGPAPEPVAEPAIESLPAPVTLSLSEPVAGPAVESLPDPVVEPVAEEAAPEPPAPEPPAPEPPAADAPSAEPFAEETPSPEADPEAPAVEAPAPAARPWARDLQTAAALLRELSMDMSEPWTAGPGSAPVPASNDGKAAASADPLTDTGRTPRDAPEAPAAETSAPAAAPTPLGGPSFTDTAALLRELSSVNGAAEDDRGAPGTGPAPLPGRPGATPLPELKKRKARFAR